MTLQEAERQASNFGFRLESYTVDGIRLWRWSRGLDRTWPEFLSEAQARDWMDLRLRTASLFNR